MDADEINELAEQIFADIRWAIGESNIKLAGNEIIKDIACRIRWSQNERK